MTAPLIEAMARGMREAVDIDYPDRVVESAIAALTAIAEAGYAVVPKTITPQLLDALDDEAPPVGCCIMDRRTATEIYDLMVFHAMIQAGKVKP